MNTASLSPLTWLDYTLLGVFFISLIVSLFRGFLRELISLIALIVGFIVGLRYSNVIEGYFAQWISSAGLRHTVAFLILFGAVLLVGMFINGIIRTFMGNSPLSVADRFLGLLFGACRGLLLMVVLLLVIEVGVQGGMQIVQKSKLAPHFQKAVDWVQQRLPATINTLGNAINDSKHGQVGAPAAKTKGAR